MWQRKVNHLHSLYRSTSAKVKVHEPGRAVAATGRRFKGTAKNVVQLVEAKLFSTSSPLKITNANSYF